MAVTTVRSRSDGGSNGGNRVVTPATLVVTKPSLFGKYVLPIHIDQVLAQESVPVLPGGPSTTLLFRLNQSPATLII